jgi:multidrug efflux system membrane fusion protein
MNPVVKSLTAVLGTFTAGLLALACGPEPKAAPNGNTGPAQAPVTVSAAPVLQKAMPVTIDLIGAAEALSSVEIRAQVTGELTSVNFRDGGEVVKGQELFTLDRRPLEAALQQAQANLSRDVAQLANAEAQLRRHQDLADRGIATKEQLDQSRTNVTALEATAAADRAAVNNAEVQLAYATIRAPITGRVGKLLVSVGNLVRANDATPLVVINQLSPIYVTFALPEAQLPELNRYRARGPIPVEARAPSDTGSSPRGVLAFVDNAIDPSTGTIAARATFANADRRLWPGQFVNVTITLDTDPDAIVVPSAAVQDSQQGPFVFVVAPDKTAELRPVRVVRTAGAESVIENGAQPGELVVTDGQLRLAPGVPVAIRAAQTTGAAR